MKKCFTLRKRGYEFKTQLLTHKLRKEPNMEEHTSELQTHKHLEDLEYFSLKLNALKDTLDMISAAFEQQQIGQDVVSCIDTLSHSVNDIRHEMQDKIQALLNG